MDEGPIPKQTDIPSVIEEVPTVAEQEINPTTAENENVESCSIQDIDASSALQLTLSGDSLQRFAKILAEKKLESAEAAIEYFFDLHVKEQCTPEKSTEENSHSTIQVDEPGSTRVVGGDDITFPQRRPGRPKGWRKNLHQKPKEDEEKMETDELPKWEGSDDGGSDDNSEETQPGSKLVDGVRKSTRKKKNPFSKTDFVPLTPRTYGGAQNSDDETTGHIVINETEGGVNEKSRDSQIIMIGEPSKSKHVQVETTADIITDEIIDIDTMDSISDNLTEVNEGTEENINDIHVQVIVPEKYQHTNSTSNEIRKTRRLDRENEETKKPGRPRKRKKEAVLFQSEKSTKACQKCNQQFETLSALGRHKMSAHGREGHPYFCEHCDYTAQFDCDMKRHQLVHNKDKTHKCDICNFSTNWSKNLELHKQNVHGNREPWKCDRCDEIIHNQSKVRQHMLSHKPTAKKCPHCGLLFEKISSLKSHIKNHGSEKEMKTLECNYCDFTTVYRVELRTHQDKVHLTDLTLPVREPRRKKEEKCGVCNKLLVDREQLEVHMQLHEPNNRDNEKPYYCLHCDARSVDINQMVRHRMVHSEERPFMCPHCGYKTRWKKDLKTHLLIHTGNKTVHCSKCNYSCYTKQRLKTHMLRHDVTRRHTCTLCNMSFKSKQALRMHTMYHTGDAQYSCDQCEFKTVTEMRLRKHKLRHTDERNYSCDLCGKRFKQAHHVTQHRDIVHLGKPSYREKKRIQLQQNAVEALGTIFRSDRGTDISAIGPCQVINDDGTTTILDLQTVGNTLTSNHRMELENEPTQYVMVETPQGYQYVAVVVPDSGETAGLDGTEVVSQGDPLQHTQVLLEENPSLRSDTVEVTSVTTDNQPEIFYTTTSENSTVQVLTTDGK